MCDCIKYKDFFNVNRIDEIQVLKEELQSINEIIYDPELVQKVKDLHFGQNKNAAQIAKELNISYYRISRIFREIGGTLKTLNKISDETKNLIKDLHFRQNKNAFQISKELNISHTSVSDIIKKMGGNIEPHTVITPELIEKVKYLHFQKKMNLNSIARELGYSRIVIRNIFNKIGGKTRKMEFITPEIIKSVKDLYDSNPNPSTPYTQDYIAKTLKLSQHLVRKSLQILNIKRNKVKHRFVNGLTSDQIEHIQLLLNQDKNYKEIADIYRTTPETISFAVKHLKLKVKPRYKRPAGMNDEDYFVYLQKTFQSELEKLNYIYNYRKERCMCVRCGVQLEKTNDNKCPSAYCKKCNFNQKKKHREKKQQIVDYKGGKCVKCNYDKNICALDLHHRDPKIKDENWTKIRYYSVEKLKDELDKCDLVCKNCHAIIHTKQNVKINDRSRKRKIACIMYKGGFKCTKCNLNYNSNGVFQFHHLDRSTKDSNFGKMLQWPEWFDWKEGEELPQRIKDELDKCVMLCANCHAEEHFNPITGDTTDELYKEIPKEECTDDTCKHSHT